MVEYVITFNFLSAKYNYTTLCYDMHKRKIDMADEIFVVNVGGYIGSSTRSEIEYAHVTGKPVRYLEENHEK